MVFNQERTNEYQRGYFLSITRSYRCSLVKASYIGKALLFFSLEWNVGRIESYLIGAQRQAALWTRARTRKESIDLQHLWHPCSNTQELFNLRHFISFDDEMSGINADEYVAGIFQNDGNKMFDHRNWTKHQDNVIMIITELNVIKRALLINP